MKNCALFNKLFNSKVQLHTTSIFYLFDANPKTKLMYRNTSPTFPYKESLYLYK